MFFEEMLEFLAGEGELSVYICPFLLASAGSVSQAGNGAHGGL